LGLDVRGLMAIPPIPTHPEDSRVHFEALRTLRDELRPSHPSLTELSMGMTDDFEIAIEEGASIIRVGRAIFGPRNTTGE
jgi:PLP dependent protein